MNARTPYPGRGGQARMAPRGRQPDPQAQAEIAALLGDAPRRRDLLIEHLHRVQDRYGAISPAHLVALAEEMRLSLADVYETATFYAHFDVLRDGEAAPPARTIRICDGVACRMRGAEEAIAQWRGAAQARVLRAPCIGQCDRAPAAQIDKQPVRATDLRALPCRPVAESGGDYAILRMLREGALSIESALDVLDAAGLRGMGGAGFPTARKWRAVRAQPGRKYVVVNADEGEPGTFKDRLLIESAAERVLEGALIAAHCVGAEEIFFYLRDEYSYLRPRLEEAIARAPGAVTLRLGAGAYICGEESALIESLEGKRGYPRQRPPLTVEAGLFGRPTLTNNVETLVFVRDILQRGADWWRAQGRNGATGLRHYSVSGRVAEPGVKLAPAGVTLAELLRDHCGGMAHGHELAAFLPGGASGGILPAALADVPLDFGALEPHGAFIGSAAIVVFSQEDDLIDVARHLMDFFAHESCGQCTPCRVGTAKSAQLMQAARWDWPLLAELGAAMRDASICGLGQAAPNPVLTLLRHFPQLAGARA